MERVTRAQSKERTRQKLLLAAQRLFREQGYAATSLDQIAEAAALTKGAIYGHFSSKEDLLLSAVEAAPTPDFGTVLNDPSRPARERLAEFGLAAATDDELAGDRLELAVTLEFIAALLRNPRELGRYGADHRRRLVEHVEQDPDQPLPGISKEQAWTIGYALFLGLRVYQEIAPEILTPSVFARAYELIAGLYP
ncbi:MAG: TetR family transcriptional regulator [Actinomycetota bacterium]|nr:TetR family transcriptional regulator [Actinomycetota bacterium]